METKKTRIAFTAAHHSPAWQRGSLEGQQLRGAGSSSPRKRQQNKIICIYLPYSQGEGPGEGEHMFVKRNVRNDLTGVLEPVIIDVVGKTKQRNIEGLVPSRL